MDAFTFFTDYIEHASFIFNIQVIKITSGRDV